MAGVDGARGWAGSAALEQMAGEVPAHFDYRDSVASVNALARDL